MITLFLQLDQLDTPAVSLCQNGRIFALRKGALTVLKVICTCSSLSEVGDTKDKLTCKNHTRPEGQVKATNLQTEGKQNQLALARVWAASGQRVEWAERKQNQRKGEGISTSSEFQEIRNCSRRASQLQLTAKEGTSWKRTVVFKIFTKKIAPSISLRSFVNLDCEMARQLSGCSSTSPGQVRQSRESDCPPPSPSQPSLHPPHDDAYFEVRKGFQPRHPHRQNTTR